jgi:hypothetical protein
VAGGALLARLYLSDLEKVVVDVLVSTRLAVDASTCRIAMLSETTAPAREFNNLEGSVLVSPRFAHLIGPADGNGALRSTRRLAYPGLSPVEAL